MADNSTIEWTDATWNPIRARHSATGKIGWHCAHVSEGCRNCYAEIFNKRFGTGLAYKPGHESEIEIFLDGKMLIAPLRWRKPRKIFVGSTTDLFADFVKDEWIDRMFAVMALCPQHTFQVLTKRPERMQTYLTRGGNAFEAGCVIAAGSALETVEHNPKNRIVARHRLAHMPLPNVWLGTSCEDQAAADERIPHLLTTPAEVRFLSCEPMLGPIDLTSIALSDGFKKATGYSTYNALTAVGKHGRDGRLLHWVICGGESGPAARPMHPAWPRALRDQCANTVPVTVPFFFKQYGEWVQFEKCHFGVADSADRWRAVYPDGRVERTNIAGPKNPHSSETDMIRIGKALAGRLLDGVEHNAFPEAHA